ncbi:unnamed protein product [Aphanomyces euteiches]
MSAFPVCSGVARTVDTSLATWTNDLSTFVSGKTNFCDCGFGGQVPACNGFICAGGDGDGGGGMCQQKACTGGGYTFDANDDWRIKNSMGGTPWRAFAYIEPCGPNNSNSCVNEMAFSFKFQNSATWGGWINLLFFGDSNKVLGLWPNKGMQLVGFPPGDMPNTWAGNLTMVDGEWYDVKVTLGINSSTYMTAQIAHGDTFVKWTSPEPRTALNRAYIGMYTFSPAGPAVTLSLKNFCMGKDNTCNWKCGSEANLCTHSTTHIWTNPTSHVRTNTTTNVCTGTNPASNVRPTQRPTSAPSSSPSRRPTPTPSKSPVTRPPATPSPSSIGNVPAYGQCGGNNYQGSTECVADYHCNEYSEWYSQCIPNHY